MPPFCYCSHQIGTGKFFFMIFVTLTEHWKSVPQTFLFFGSYSKQWSRRQTVREAPHPLGTRMKWQKNVQKSWHRRQQHERGFSAQCLCLALHEVHVALLSLWQCTLFHNAGVQCKSFIREALFCLCVNMQRQQKQASAGRISSQKLLPCRHHLILVCAVTSLVTRPALPLWPPLLGQRGISFTGPQPRPWRSWPPRAWPPRPCWRPWATTAGGRNPLTTCDRCK